MLVVPELPPRYNVAPTQPVAAVRRAAGEARRELVMLRWGLVPFWADDLKIGAKHINARSESAADKPAFRAAFRERRCLIVADGFFEWQKVGSKKQPYLFQMKDGRPFAFAGLWDRWRDPDKNRIESCTILTTKANELVSLLHDRMPVILKPADYERWLDPQVQDLESLQPLLCPFDSEAMSAQPVSKQVNNARNDDPTCIAPVPRNLFGDPDVG